MCHEIILDVPYEQQKLKHCSSHFGSYSTLDTAMSACNSNSYCGGVLDQSCNNKEPFYLCPISIPLVEASSMAAKGCVYRKIGT